MTASAGPGHAAGEGRGQVLRVLQITDTHLFADTAGELGGLNTAASEVEVLARVRERAARPDLVLATGDLVHDGSEAGYRRLRAHLEGLAERTLVIPGNHDDPEVMARVFAAGAVTWTPAAVIGGWHFLMLNTWQPDSPGGRIGDDQLAAMGRRLAARPQLPALIALHHQPVAVGSDWIDRIGVADADALLACIDRHPQVRAVIWGHVHQAFEAERNGVRLLASPSTCIQFQPASGEFALDDRPPGFRWLELDGEGAVRTGVERIDRPVGRVDRRCAGYR